MVIISYFSSDIKDIAKRLYQKEALLTEEVREQLVQCLETLKKRIEHEGPTGKRFYIYKTLQTHVLPLTNVAFDKTGKRYS
jgi:dynein assembly factor with WDR repeat domains 1